MVTRDTKGFSIWQTVAETSVVIETPHSCLTGEYEHNFEKQIEVVASGALVLVEEYQRWITPIYEKVQYEDERHRINRFLKVNEVRLIRLQCFLPDLTLLGKMKDELSMAFQRTNCEVHIYSIDWDRFVLRLDFGA